MTTTTILGQEFVSISLEGSPEGSIVNETPVIFDRLGRSWRSPGLRWTTLCAYDCGATTDRRAMRRARNA
jgi:hypothetical protein